ncbi:MAG: hypothetical protein CL785_06205 [Chloroflexi bacterium]|nr:hypothetical protein [Chloroflexota bacterium]
MKTIVYTLPNCRGSDALREIWLQDGVNFEERRVDLNQEWLEEARDYGDVVPIIVYPDGSSKEGWDLTGVPG